MFILLSVGLHSLKVYLDYLLRKGSTFITLTVLFSWSVRSSKNILVIVLYLFTTVAWRFYFKMRLYAKNLLKASIPKFKHEMQLNCWSLYMCLVQYWRPVPPHTLAGYTGSLYWYPAWDWVAGTVLVGLYSTGGLSLLSVLAVCTGCFYWQDVLAACTGNLYCRPLLAACACGLHYRAVLAACTGGLYWQPACKIFCSCLRSLSFFTRDSVAEGCTYEEALGRPTYFYEQI